MKYKGKRTLSLLLVAAVMLAVPVLASAAGLTFDESGSVTNATALKFIVGPNTDEEYFADVASAGVQVDLYKVADAVAEDVAEGENGHGSMYVFKNGKYGVSGVDTYEGLAALTNDDWRAMAQTAANQLFAGTATPDVTLTSADGVTVEQSVPAGLYLVVAHDKDLTQDDYVVREDGNVRTIADSDLYEYTYYPELLALPTTVDSMGVITTLENGDPGVTYNTYTDAEGNPQTGVSTAGGDWKEALTAMLKPTREFRNGFLTIEKTVDNWETTTPATFVFHVKATQEREGKNVTVYEDYVSITWPQENHKDIWDIDPETGEPVGIIPVGAVVTVEEVNTGSCYELVSITGSGSVIPAPIKGEDGQPAKLTVKAVNTYDERITQGYGIENTFTSNGSRWVWNGEAGEAK